ncbi:TPA: hypothetical protein ACX6RS_000176 [Photobacterium damselae]|uniref:hypothetical protein n=1 Tax=Photobacterium damselae TaxID=38293 RepID=UPI000DFAF219|nr:hypothetical protein [Photobacterium damselae]SUB66691.1 Uncharacterised protein [Photobacterium damselae]
MDKIFEQFDGAKSFFDETILMYKSSNFEEYMCAVVATDEVDLHNECLTLDALRSAESKINSYGLPFNAHHDPRIAPLGKTLLAKVIRSNDGSKNYLFGVIGLYSQSFYKSLPKNISETNYVPNSEDYCKNDIELAFSHNEVDESLIDEAISNSPCFVSKKVNKDVRKAADPITILSFAIPAAIVYPFAKKYMEKNGEYVAELQKQFVRWLFKYFVKKLNRKTLYEFSSPYRGCSVKYIVETKSTIEIRSAIESIEIAGDKAKKLIDSMYDKNPTVLIYVFDSEVSDWIPSYVKTQNGDIYTDKPYLMAKEQFGGVSIGARMVG